MTQREMFHAWLQAESGLPFSEWCRQHGLEPPADVPVHEPIALSVAIGLVLGCLVFTVVMVAWSVLGW